MLKVLDENGAGYTSDVIDAIEFVTGTRPSLASTSSTCRSATRFYEPAATDPLVQAVEAAVRAGIVVVAAGRQLRRLAGNGRAGVCRHPVARQCALGDHRRIRQGRSRRTCAATIASRTTAREGRRGTTARPSLIWSLPAMVSLRRPRRSSTLYMNNPALRVGESYLRLSGTSMAAAVVSGTVALILEASRNASPSGTPLTPNAVKAILQFTALPVRDDQGVEYDYLTQGTGSVNAAGAIELAAHIDTTRPVSSSWLTSNVNPSTIDRRSDPCPGPRALCGATRSASARSLYINQAAWTAEHRLGQ